MHTTRIDTKSIEGKPCALLKQAKTSSAESGQSLKKANSWAVLSLGGTNTFQLIKTAPEACRFAGAEQRQRRG
jgi:hypothetical protein